MKVTAKRLFLAFCVVLCVATAGWCIDPFKANKGGFGPKIKGVQLGMKMSLLDIVVWRVSQEKWPLRLKVGVNNGVNKSYCAIEFTGEGHELKGFKVTEAEGKYAPIKNKQGKLGDILAEIEKLGLESAGIASQVRVINIINLNKDMRVNYMCFEQSDFGAEQMTPKEFALAIMDAYHIPGMDGVRGNPSGWQHRNLSEGWEIFCWDNGGLKVTPIVTQSKFD